MKQAMRNLVLAGVSAVALALSGGGLALAAGNSSQGAYNGSAMTNSQGSGGSQAANHASPNEIKQAQQKLKQEGLYKGRIDGIAGPETQQALEQFQKKNNLQQTGQLDEQTEAKLGMSEAQQQSGSSMPPSGMSGSSGQSNSSSTGSGQRQ